MSEAVLTTRRLHVRAFVEADLDAIHRILDQAFGDGSKPNDDAAREERRSWLRWSALSQRWLPALHQLPYGERAVVRTDSNELIGAMGLVPLLDRYEQIPGLRIGPGDSGLCTPEVGLFWVIAPEQQRKGYATECGRALIDFAFEQLRLRRLLATTKRSNLASQAVMRKLGMSLFDNPERDPPWLEVVGLLDNPSARLQDARRAHE
jgi:RimJ/RimL family protein N-acetyltransferase